MWGVNHIYYDPKNPNHDFDFNIEDMDGYPVERWKKIEAEFIKKNKEKNPNFVYRDLNKIQKSKQTTFIDYPDRPRRRMYWLLETDSVPPSKRKKSS